MMDINGWSSNPFSTPLVAGSHMCLTHTKPPCFLTKSWFECASSMDRNGIMNRWMISNWVYTTQKRSEKIDNVYYHILSPTLIGIYLIHRCMHLVATISHYKGGTFGRLASTCRKNFGRSGSDGIPTTPWMSAPFWLKKTSWYLEYDIQVPWYTG